MRRESERLTPLEDAVVEPHAQLRLGPDSLAQLPDEVPLRAIVARVPAEGLRRTPVAKPFVMLGGQHDVPCAGVGEELGPLLRLPELRGEHRAELLVGEVGAVCPVVEGDHLGGRQALQVCGRPTTAAL